MDDTGIMKEELLIELAALRQRVLELERSVESRANAGLVELSVPREICF